jgi:hypothetical protein
MTVERDFSWKPGTVMSMHGRTSVAAGQRWGYFKTREDGTIALVPPDPNGVLPLTVISTCPEGEVVLRPADPQVAEMFFPEVEDTFKGTPVRVRKGCPFRWVDAAYVRATKGKYTLGDLLAHEAWTCWADMHLHQSREPAPAV